MQTNVLPSYKAPGRFPHLLIAIMLCCLIIFVTKVGAVDSQEPLQPLPAIQLDPIKVALGKKLFHDKRLSRDNTISCASCHDLMQGGVDRQRISRGVGGAEGMINSPSVLNSGLNFRQFWDGRAASLEDQIDGPIHNGVEMASNWQEIIGKLSQDAHYRQTFAALYPDGIRSHTIKDAIATFERSLAIPSRFDQYLLGNASAINNEEKKGYELFKNYGCVACHQGVNIGGNMYQYFGVAGNYFADRGNITEADYGRYNVTHKEQDRFMFKVPSLRNVALTPPYFHDGSAQTLEDAVAVMAKYQLGRTLSAQDRQLIVAFLKSLTGESSSPSENPSAKTAQK